MIPKIWLLVNAFIAVGLFDPVLFFRCSFRMNSSVVFDRMSVPIALDVGSWWSLNCRCYTSCRSLNDKMKQRLYNRFRASCSHAFAYMCTYIYVCVSVCVCVHMKCGICGKRWKWNVFLFNIIYSINRIMSVWICMYVCIHVYICMCLWCVCACACGKVCKMTFATFVKQTNVNRDKNKNNNALDQKTNSERRRGVYPRCTETLDNEWYNKHWTSVGYYDS